MLILQGYMYVSDNVIHFEIFSTIVITPKIVLLKLPSVQEIQFFYPFELTLDTVVCKLDGKGYFGLETRVFIKISTFLTYNCWLIFMRMKQKKIQNCRLKKRSFSSPTNSEYLFSKISWIGPWVSRVEWCEGHWCGSTYHFLFKPLFRG